MKHDTYGILTTASGVIDTCYRATRWIRPADGLFWPFADDSQLLSPSFDHLSFNNLDAEGTLVFNSARVGRDTTLVLALSCFQKIVDRVSVSFCGTARVSEISTASCTS